MSHDGLKKLTRCVGSQKIGFYQNEKDMGISKYLGVVSDLRDDDKSYKSVREKKAKEETKVLVTH